MRRLSSALALTLVLTACGSGPEATASIHGTVRAGPTCPVETIESPCPPAPWAGTVRATATDGETHQTTTDEQGAYSLALPPGTYEVVAVTGDGSPPFGVPASVTVTQGEDAQLDLAVDTGIR